MTSLKHIAFVTLFSLLPLCSTSFGQTKPYDQFVLGRILAATRTLVSENKRPIVIFDLDDTLFDSRPRAVAILAELATTTNFAQAYPNEAARLLKVRPQDIAYHLEDTLQHQGITDADLILKIRDYYLPRFFSTGYCAADPAIAGAASYVRALVRSGALVVYVSGRDRPSMGEGTKSALEREGFPLGRHAKLAMRPSATADELKFKRQVFSAVSHLGSVIAGFENEPRNVNLLHELFPSGQMVFVDTIHSNKPDVPAKGVVWIPNFKRAQ